MKPADIYLRININPCIGLDKMKKRKNNTFLQSYIGSGSPHVPSLIFLTSPPKQLLSFLPSWQEDPCSMVLRVEKAVGFPPPDSAFVSDFGRAIVISCGTKAGLREHPENHFRG